MTDSPLFSANLLLAYSAYLVATASPGPSNLAIMAIAMNSGRQSALLFALGVVSGSFFWAVLAAFGLSAVLASYSQVLILIKLLGGLYLLWLASKSARAAFTPAAPPSLKRDREMEPALRLYARGLGLHITNPKAILPGSPSSHWHCRPAPRSPRRFRWLQAACVWVYWYSGATRWLFPRLRQGAFTALPDAGWKAHWHWCSVWRASSC